MWPIRRGKIGPRFARVDHALSLAIDWFQATPLRPSYAARCLRFGWVRKIADNATSSATVQHPAAAKIAPGDPLNADTIRSDAATAIIAITAAIRRDGICPGLLRPAVRSIIVVVSVPSAPIDSA